MKIKYGKVSRNRLRNYWIASYWTYDIDPHDLMHAMYYDAKGRYT